MVVERRFEGCKYRKVLIFACVVTVVLSSGLAAAEQNSAKKLARYRVFALKNISANQGRSYLHEVRIGTVSQLPGHNTLLVTAQPDELVKASAILRLVDAEQQFVIREILPASEAGKLPSNKRIAEELGDMVISGFSDFATEKDKNKAIIDVHNDSVIAIAPAERIGEIISAIERLQEQKAEPQPLQPAVTEGQLAPSEPVETNDTADRESDKLYEMLEKAQEIMAEQTRAKQLSRQDEPLPRSQGPEVTALAQQPTELFEQEKIADADVTEPLKQAPAVAESTVAEDTADMPEPELRYEPESRAGLYRPQPIDIGDEMLELDLPEKLNVVDLLDLVGKYLNLDYMYDPAKIGGDVALKLQGPVKVKDLYPLLESVLKFKNFVMTRKGNLVTIVPAAEVLNVDPALLYVDEDKVQYGDVIVTRVFELEYIDTESVRNLLTGLKLSVNITPIVETGTLIVTGYAYRMARIEEIIDMVDRPGEPKHFRFRQLRYTMAKTLAPKVKELAEQLGTVSISILAQPAPAPPKQPRRGRRPAPRRVAKPAAKKAAAKPSVYLDADERTNRILMIGLEGQLAVVEDLIDALDVEQQDLRTLRLYEIQYVGAEEIKAKLGELGIIGGGGQVTVRGARSTRSAKSAKPAKSAAKPRTTGTASAAAAEALVEEPQVVIIESTNSLLVNATAEQHIQIAMIISYVDSETLELAIPYVIYPLENQNPEDLAGVLNQLIQETVKDKDGKIERVIKKEEGITIIADENTFSLIVYASRKNQEWIGSLIRNLDKRRPQVLIDVTLVEVTKSDSFEYDLNLISSFPDLTSTSGLTSAIMSVVDVNNQSNLVSKLTSSGRDRFIDLQANKGVGTGFYGDRHINALLTAMQDKTYGRVLAKPKILVNDNETGTIKTVDTVYVKKTTTSFIEGTTSTAQGVQYDPYNAGITLDITPHISEGSLLRLDIVLSRSDFGTTVGDKPPDTVGSDISTTVTVPDGSTIILGGMLKLNQGKGGTKVPLLGDIPLIGGLFRTVDNSDIQKKLYVFVKAEILRPTDAYAGLPDLERISDRNRRAFEEFEDKFQQYQDWPGAKPKPMDPLRVLEAE